MKKILKYTLRENQYYPTPSKLIKDILAELEFRDLEEVNFLEPCAGDGAICREIKNHFKEEDKPVNISCIEIEKTLCNSLKGQGFKVIGEDFEEFESIPFYDLIFMNPPFSKGVKFLLKAYKFLNAEGKLICLLNAETINNPCNKEREILNNLIERTGETYFLEKAFENSDRKTGVKIAVVIINKPLYENEFDIFGGIKEEVITEEEKIREELKNKVESTDLMSFDKLDHSISIYRNAVKQIFQGIDTIKKIKDSLKYIETESEEFNIKMEDFIKLILEQDQEEAKESSIKIIRKMVWSYVLKFCDMDKYLFSKQKSDFYDKLDKGSASLPFTKDNILQFFNNIFHSRIEYLHKGIEDLFEEITGKHSGNRYGEGWKTNKNWKIGKKIIVDWGITFNSWTPDYNPERDNRRYGDFRLSYDSLEWLNDLDKIVRKIQPVPLAFESNFIREALDNRFRQLGNVYAGEKFDNTTETFYFDLKFFKKGSLHITFKDETILRELNILGAKLRTDLGYDDWGKKETTGCEE